MDSLPIPNWISMVSKLITLILIPGIMLPVLMFIGIGIQTWRGFYDYEIHLYLKATSSLGLDRLCTAVCFSFFNPNGGKP